MTSEIADAEWGKGNATFVFGDLKGYTSIVERASDEDVAVLVADLFHRFATEIERRGGRLAQQFREGDGFLAMFGYPTRREDDPERALRCSLELQRISRDSQSEIRQRLGTELPLRLGITTGPIVVERHDWGENFTGDAVNVAARLEGLAAPGEILVSEVTRRLVPDRFDWGPAQSLNVKGRSRAVAARTLEGARSETILRAGSGPFIGRAAELGELTAAWGKALIEGPQTVVVEGPAGCGKSRLVHEFVGRLQEQGHDPHLALGSAPAFGTAALDPLRRMIVGCYESPEMAEVTLEPLAAASVDALISAGGANIRPVRRRADFVAGLAAFFSQWLGDTPGIVVLEDAHWADSTTLRLLGEIAHRLHDRQLLLLILQRSGGGGSLPRQVRSRAHTIKLSQLRVDECEQLLDALLSPELVGDRALRNTILAKSEGSPFFIEEIVKMIARDRRDTDGPADASAAVDRIPASIEQIFLARLDEIDERSRRIAQEAAVIGRSFPDELLAAVTEGTVGGALRRLEREETLRYWESEAAEEGHEFTHYLTWNTIYESLLMRRRSELHLRTAEAIEALYPDAIDRHAEVLALHYELGGRKDKAIECYLRAQERSEAVHARPEARAHGRRSAELAGLTSLWSLSRKEAGLATKIGAVVAQFAVGALVLSPVVIFMLLRTPADSVRTLGLPDAIYGLSFATVAVPLVLGIVPVFVSAVVFANLRAPAYLRRTPRAAMLVRDVALAWVFQLAISIALIGLAYLFVRSGYFGIVADMYFTSTAARIIAGQAGQIVVTFAVASLLVAVALVWYLAHKSARWRTYLGQRSQTGHSVDEASAGRAYSQLARLALVAIGLATLALLLQLLPYRSFEVDMDAQIRSNLFLVGSIVVLCIAAAWLTALSRGISGIAGVRSGIEAMVRSLRIGRRPVHRPGGLGIEGPLVLAAIFGIAVLVPVRTGLIHTFQGRLDPLDIEQAETLVDWFPESPFAYASRGSVYLADGRRASIEQAVADYETSLAVDPAFVIAYVGLSNAEAKRGNFEAALDAADTWVSLASDHPSPYLWRSQMRAINDDLGGALDDRGIAMSFDADDAQWDALVALCTVKYQSGLTEAALRDCTEAADANPYLLSRSSGFRGDFVSLFRSAGRVDEVLDILHDAGLDDGEAALALAPISDEDFDNEWDFSAQRHIPLGASNDVPGYRGLAGEHRVRDGYLSFFLDQPRDGADPSLVIQTVTLYEDDEGAAFGFTDHTSASGYERFRGGPNFLGSAGDEFSVSRILEEPIDLDDGAMRSSYVVAAGQGMRVEHVIVVRQGLVVSMYVLTSDVRADIDLEELARQGQARIAEWFRDL